MATDCIIYCRVSTEQQLLDRQIQLCRAFAQDNDYNVLRLYQEKISGATFDRPAFTEMMTELDDLEPEALIVSDFDRFSRGEGHTSVAAQKEITGRGVRIVGIIDNGRAGPEDTIEQDLFAKFRAEFAWYERVKMRQRMEAGFKEYLKRQKSEKGLEEGKRPIGRQPYVLNEDDIRLIRGLLRDHATKVYIWHAHIRKKKRFRKMSLNVFYQVCKRHGV